jgi:hypothetical protein
VESAVKATVKRLRNGGCKAIAKRLQSNCKANDSKATAKQLQSDCKAMSNQLRSDCKATAKRLQINFNTSARQPQSFSRRLASCISRFIQQRFIQQRFIQQHKPSCISRFIQQHKPTRSSQISYHVPTPLSNTPLHIHHHLTHHPSLINASLPRLQDLFPDSAAGIASCTSSEWYSDGVDASPLLMSLDPDNKRKVTESTKKKAEAPSFVANKSAYQLSNDLSLALARMKVLEDRLSSAGHALPGEGAGAMDQVDDSAEQAAMIKAEQEAAAARATEERNAAAKRQIAAEKAQRKAEEEAELERQREEREAQREREQEVLRQEEERMVKEREEAARW